MKADNITGADMLRFTWREKWNLINFLKWAGSLERQSIPKKQ
ncbi:MAG TPA: hypothetical protein VGT04_03565 [Acidobacteriaceae bacterium]|nr:hypothetical protein [Acidobacteriaceae bacterium]